MIQPPHRHGRQVVKIQHIEQIKAASAGWAKNSGELIGYPRKSNP